MGAITIQNGISLHGDIAAPPSKSEGIRACILLTLCGRDAECAFDGFIKPLCDDLTNAISACKSIASVPYVGASAALLRMLVPVQLALFGASEVILDFSLARRGLDEFEAVFGVPCSLKPVSDSRVRLTLKKRLTDDDYRVPCLRSSQLVSGLIIALGLLKTPKRIICSPPVSRGYVDMTAAFARAFGSDVKSTEYGYSIENPIGYKAPHSVAIHGDWSYAANFFAANSFGSEVEVLGLDEPSAYSLQPDCRIGELMGKGEVDVTDCPDLFPPLAAAACGRAGKTVFFGTDRLRYKESDRPAAMSAVINALGGKALVGGDYVEVNGGGTLIGGECDAKNDHRIAMAAAIMSKLCVSPVVIKGHEAVSKSAPLFFNDFISLGGKCE